MLRGRVFGNAPVNVAGTNGSTSVNVSSSGGCTIVNGSVECWRVWTRFSATPSKIEGL